MAAFCTSCGEKLPGNVKYCHVCGERVNRNAGASLAVGSSPPSVSSEFRERPKKFVDRPAPRERFSFIGFLVKHWRGEYPISVVVIVSGFIAFFMQAIFVSLLSLPEDGSDMRSRVSAGALLAGTGLIWFLFPIWYWIGAFSKADNLIFLQKRILSAFFTLLVPSLLITILFWRGGALHMGLMSEGFSLLSKNRQPTFRITKSWMRTAKFEGEITFGAAIALSEFLASNRDINTIELRSHGGSISEGVAMARIVSMFELSTSTGGECSSSCTLVFIAGSERILLDGGRLGFHSARWNGGNGILEYSVNQELRDAYEDSMVDPFFIDKALSYPPEKMWYPDKELLIKANFVSG